MFRHVETKCVQLLRFQAEGGLHLTTMSILLYSATDSENMVTVFWLYERVPKVRASRRTPPEKKIRFWLLEVTFSDRMLTDFHETVETDMFLCLYSIWDFSLAEIDNPLGISTICISTGRSRISVYSIFFGFTQTWKRLKGQKCYSGARCKTRFWAIALG